MCVQFNFPGLVRYIVYITYMCFGDWPLGDLYIRFGAGWRNVDWCADWICVGEVSLGRNCFEFCCFCSVLYSIFFFLLSTLSGPFTWFWRIPVCCSVVWVQTCCRSLQVCRLWAEAHFCVVLLVWKMNLICNSLVWDNLNIDIWTLISHNSSWTAKI